MKTSTEKFYYVTKSPSLSCLPDIKTATYRSKFKFEHGGMLVYDQKADIIKASISANENSSTSVERIPALDIPKQKKIKGMSDEDFEVYCKLKNFPSCPEFPTTYYLYIPDDNITLLFNSKFESGNLLRAVKLSDYEYNLHIQSDVNTHGNNHWYYFSVYNPRKTPVTFNIVNMKRRDFLYLSGMKPVVWSSKTHKEKNIKWHRDCSSISYKVNTHNIYYTLSFTYNFRYEEDLAYFAYSIPYTYQDLCSYLENIQQQYKEILRVNVLCKTITSNNCFILTITEGIKSFWKFNDEALDWEKSAGGRNLNKIKKAKNMESGNAEEHKHKKAIVLTARVHSGESVSSFMIKGAIDFLLSNQRHARLLRRNFIFRIIPMLNPDGVRYGNFRCSLLGVDLNRRWDSPHKLLHPTIYYAKKMIQVLNENHKIELFCDIHGHTRKKNVFMYGCSQKHSDYLIHRKNLLAKIIPVLMSNRNKFFSFKDSHFRMEKDKESTARIVLYKLLDIPHIYTMEASFFGPNYPEAFGNNYCGDMHMAEENLESLGESLCRLCLIFLSQYILFKNVRLVNDYLRNVVENNKKTEHENKNSLSFIEDDELDEIYNDYNIEEEEKGDEEGEGKGKGKEKVKAREKEKEKERRIEKSKGKGKGKERNQDAYMEIDKAKEEMFWEDIKIIDIAESDNSGGSDSCPSERNSPIRRTKSNFRSIRKVQAPIIIRSPSTEQLKKQKELNISTFRCNKSTVLHSKVFIVPSINSTRINIGITAPITIPTRKEYMTSDSAKFQIPSLRPQQRLYDKPSNPNTKHHSLKSINRPGKIPSTESMNDNSVMSRNIISPRTYKLNTITWLGPKVEALQRKIINNINT